MLLELPLVFFFKIDILSNMIKLIVKLRSQIQQANRSNISIISELWNFSSCCSSKDVSFVSILRVVVVIVVVMVVVLLTWNAWWIEVLNSPNSQPLRVKWHNWSRNIGKLVTKKLSEMRSRFRVIRLQIRFVSRLLDFFNSNWSLLQTPCYNVKFIS